MNANKLLHRTVIPLRSIAAGDYERYVAILIVPARHISDLRV